MRPILTTRNNFITLHNFLEAYLRAVECARMRVDENGITWVCHPKYMDHMGADVRTSTLPWELLNGQRLFAPQP